MSSCVEGATSARIPSQPNGYSRVRAVSTPSGIESRQTPWEPSQPAMDQVLQDLLLAVDHDRPPDEIGEVDPVALAVVAQLDALVDRSLAVHPLAYPGLAQRVHRPLLEDAGADAVHDVVLVAVLEHDGLDTVEVQQV